MADAPHPIDAEIGARIRIRRKCLSLTQAELAAELGVTFQQLQKYEKGANRISVGRMIDIANVLGVDISYFFEGLTGNKKAPGFTEAAQPPFVSDFMATQEGHQLMRAFARIKNSKTRRAISQLATNLADEEGEGRSK